MSFCFVLSSLLYHASDCYLLIINIFPMLTWWGFLTTSLKVWKSKCVHFPTQYLTPSQCSVVSGYQCFIWTIAFCLSVRKVKNVHYNVLTLASWPGVRERAMCHVTLEPDIVMVWTPLPQHWPVTTAIIDLQMSDNHCHIHAVIVKLGWTLHRAGWLRGQFTIFKTSRKETWECDASVWAGQRLVVLHYPVHVIHTF